MIALLEKFQMSCRDEEKLKELSMFVHKTSLVMQAQQPSHTPPPVYKEDAAITPADKYNQRLLEERKLMELSTLSPKQADLEMRKQPVPKHEPARMRKHLTLPPIFHMGGISRHNPPNYKA